MATPPPFLFSLAVCRKKYPGGQGDVLLNGLKPAISDLVWNRANIHNATYAQAIEMAEECEKIVEVRKIAKSKDLSSAVTVISKENEKKHRENQQPQRYNQTDDVYIDRAITANP